MSNSLEELSKLPEENIIFDMNFGKRMASGETISAIVSTTFVNEGVVEASSDIVLGATAFSVNIAQVRISAGTQNEQYEVAMQVTTSSGNTRVGKGLLRIE